MTDSHAHLASKQFATDLPQIIERARSNGISRIICISTQLTDSQQVLQIADSYPEVFAAVGIHPCDADSIPLNDSSFIGQLRQLAQHPKVLAIGEIGLDYYHQPPQGFTLDSWKQHQAFVLHQQLALAAELKLNVVLHNRDSFADLSTQILPWTGKLRAVFHCFTGTEHDALPLIENGHLISFTGIVTFKNGQIIQQTARAIPNGSFMLETDCPYLAPIPHRGKRNEPSYLTHTANCIASLRGIPLTDLITQTNQTANNFFRRP